MILNTIVAVAVAPIALLMCYIMYLDMIVLRRTLISTNDGYILRGKFRSVQLTVASIEDAWLIVLPFTILIGIKLGGRIVYFGRQRNIDMFRVFVEKVVKNIANNCRKGNAISRILDEGQSCRLQRFGIYGRRVASAALVEIGFEKTGALLMPVVIKANMHTRVSLLCGGVKLLYWMVERSEKTIILISPIQFCEYAPLLLVLATDFGDKIELKMDWRISAGARV